MAVGRKMIDGKCSYLIRNSWGGAWQGKGHKCACRTPNGYDSDCSRFNRVHDEQLALVISLNKSFGTIDKDSAQGEKDFRSGSISRAQYVEFIDRSRKTNAAMFEATKLFFKTDEEAAKRTVVGCWVKEENLIPNLISIGDLERKELSRSVSC